MNNRFTRLVAGTLFLGATALAAPSAMAQDQAFGANIYEGTCDDIATATVVSEIGALKPEAENEDVAEHWQALNLGNDALPRDLQTAAADFTDDLSVDTLLGEPHAVAIRSEADSDSDVIACGELQEAVDEQSQVSVDLSEVDGSGIEGRIVFDSEEGDDSDMIIGAWTADEAQELATPEASPMSTPIASPVS